VIPEFIIGATIDECIKGLTGKTVNDNPAHPMVSEKVLLEFGFEK
jgi:hypothetical protein